MPSEKILEQKKEVVENLKEKLLKAKSIILVDYRGLTVEEDTELRNTLRKANIEYKVIKNAIILFATKDSDLGGLAPYLKGPTALALSYDDELTTSKVLYDFAKKNDKFEVKAGAIEGKIITLDDIKSLASIPSKEVLISKMLGSLNSPIAGLVNVLNGNIRGLVVALNAIAQKKQ